MHAPATFGLSLRQKLSVLGVAVAVLFFRRPDAFLQPQLFVEDGTVFFKDDHTLGADALLKPYAGYLHLLPRLIAWASGQAPMEWRPRLYVIGCLGVTLLVVWRSLDGRVELPARWAFALCPLLMPIGPFIYLHLTNVQWFSALLLLLMLLSRPALGAAGQLLDGTLALLVGLTGPFCFPALLLTPVRLIMRGFDRRDVPVYAALLIACAVQGRLLMQASALASGSFSHLSGTFLANHGARYLLGNVGTSMLHGGRQWPALWLLGGLLGIVLLARSARYPALMLSLFTLLMAGLSIYRMAPEAGAANAFNSGIRYFFMPHLGMSYLLLLGLFGERAGRAIALPLALCAMLSAAASFTYRAPVDLHFERYCDAIRSGRPVVVPLQPKGWHMRLN